MKVMTWPSCQLIATGKTCVDYYATLTVTINVVLEYGVYDKRTYDIQNLFSAKTVDILVNEENSFQPYMHTSILNFK